VLALFKNCFDKNLTPDDFRLPNSSNSVTNAATRTSMPPGRARIDSKMKLLQLLKRENRRDPRSGGQPGVFADGLHARMFEVPVAGFGGPFTTMRTTNIRVRTPRSIGSSGFKSRKPSSGWGLLPCGSTGDYKTANCTCKVIKNSRADRDAGVGQNTVGKPNRSRHRKENKRPRSEIRKATAVVLFKEVSCGFECLICNAM